MFILLTIISVYHAFYSAYWFLLTIGGLFNKKLNIRVSDSSNPELMIILPAYKPSKLFYRVIDAIEIAIHQRNIKVFILLQDSDDPKLKEHIEAKGFYVEEKSFSKESGNVYQHALRHITKMLLQKRKDGSWNPEFVMIIDKDNIIKPTFFDVIPTGHYDSFDIIQGKRNAMQARSSISFFDMVSELLNDIMFRRAKMTLNCMIEISGSGALIETDLFIKTINNLDPIAPGFDKNFMLNLLLDKRKIRTIYWPSSALTEEKTSTINAHNPQRIRWFGEQYYNALYKGSALLKATFVHRRLSALDYLLTLWRPPRSVQLMVTPLFAITEIIYFYFWHRWYFAFPLLTLSLLLITLSIFLFLFSERLLIEAFKHSLQLPSLIFHNIHNAINSIKKKNLGKFIHTTHKL